MNRPKAETGDRDTVAASIIVERAREELWAAITGLERQQPFYFDSTLISIADEPLAPGVAIAYVVGAERREAIRGIVTVWEPPGCFAHTFRFPHLDEPESEVQWRLEAVSLKETRVSILHAGLRRAPQTTLEVSKGWRQILGRLQEGALPAS